MPLKEKLESKTIACHQDPDKRFIPHGTLERPDVLSEAVVESELSILLAQPNRPSPTELTRLAGVIINGKTGQPNSSFRKVFAILTLAGLGGKVLDFVEAEVNDSCLPILQRLDLDVTNRGRPGETHNTCVEALLPAGRARGRGTAPLSFLRNWDAGALRALLTEQWTLLSPVFEGTDANIAHYVFTPHHILPFIDMGPIVSAAVQEGSEMTQEIQSSTTVVRVKLHPCHYSFQGYSKPVWANAFALKQIPPSDRIRFEQEARALRLVTAMQEKRIIQLLATFEITSVGSFLLFPLADGDLDFMWRTQPQLRQGSNITAWIAREFCNLSQALAKIHGMDETGDDGPSMSIHGDLSSKNILWFSEGDTGCLSRSRLVIADFGYARIRRTTSPADREPEMGAWTYRAPESAVSCLPITSAIDVWSLGCTFIEFATWQLLGWNAVEGDFTRSRLEAESSGGISVDDFFVRRSDGRVEVKPSVRRWVDELTDLGSCSPFLEELLTLVMDNMLCVDAARRASAKQIADTVKVMSDRYQGDLGYCHPRSV